MGQKRNHPFRYGPYVSGNYFHLTNVPIGSAGIVHDLNLLILNEMTIFLSQVLLCRCVPLWMRITITRRIWKSHSMVVLCSATGRSASHHNTLSIFVLFTAFSSPKNLSCARVIVCFLNILDCVLPIFNCKHCFFLTSDACVFPKSAYFPVHLFETHRQS